MDNCDKCHAPIIDGRCVCGVWIDKTIEVPIIKTFETAILAYDHLCEQHNRETPLTMDHHIGVCAVFFKGDYALSKKVEQFIKDNS